MRPGRLAGVFLSACLCAACAKPVAQEMFPAPVIEAEPARPLVYVVMPARYSKYIEGGLIFQSEGLVEDLPVYKTPDDATRALFALETRAERSRGGWLVYAVDADWDEDTVEQGDGYRLSRPATVVSHEPRPHLDGVDRL